MKMQDSDNNADVINEPVSIIYNNGINTKSRMLLKIDALEAKGHLCKLTGWRTANLNMYLESDGKTVHFESIKAVSREDVNLFIGAPADSMLGFEAYAICDMGSALNLVLYSAYGDTYRFPLKTHMNKNSLTQSKNMDDVSVRDRVQNSNIEIVIDYAVRWPDERYGSPILVSGWLAAPDDIQIQCEDEHKIIIIENIVFFIRPDIASSHDLFISRQHTGNGFIFVLKDVSTSIHKLILSLARNGEKVKTAVKSINTFHNFRSFLKSVFSIPIGSSELSRIYESIFIPFLCPLQLARTEDILKARHLSGTTQNDYAPEKHTNLEASIIIPLYGNLDFLERQMDSLARTAKPGLSREIIYVLDDPFLLDPFRMGIYQLSEKYELPVRWIGWNGSQGFAGACNLGASIAKGKNLVFMNSDVFPNTAGWLDIFCNVLEDHPHIGIVGCNLFYEDGTIQHCGCALVKDKAMDIFLCEHPYAGEKLENCKKLIDPQAVTGACIAIGNKNFRAVGGWSAEYLIGGYEDIDLCFKIDMQFNRKVACLSQISMTHLAHKSFEAIDKTEDERAWLQRLAVYNAVVFRTKWSQFLIRKNHILRE